MAKGKRKQVKSNEGKSGGRQSSNKLDRLKGKTGRKRHTDKAIDLDADRDLRKALQSDGSKEIIDMDPDGNCLFRSLSDQLFRDHGSRHVEVRQDVCDFMEGHKDAFKVFLVLDDEEASEEDATDFDSYLETMRGDGEWGGNLELVAAARMYRRDIRVYSADLAAFTVPHGSDKPSSGPDLLLSYHDNEHYNSVRLTRPAKLPMPVRSFVKLVQRKESGERLENDVTDDGVDENSTEPVKESRLDLPIEEDPTLSSTDIHQESHRNNADKSRLANRQLTRHAKCPCGSGRKHRKCCHARDQLKLKVASTAPTSSDCFVHVENEMDGTFRILHI